MYLLSRGFFRLRERGAVVVLVVVVDSSPLISLLSVFLSWFLNLVLCMLEHSLLCDMFFFWRTSANKMLEPSISQDSSDESSFRTPPVSSWLRVTEPSLCRSVTGTTNQHSGTPYVGLIRNHQIVSIHCPVTCPTSTKPRRLVPSIIVLTL
jgi:hypothetical protein